MTTKTRRRLPDVRSLNNGSTGLTVDDVYAQNYFDILIGPVISNLLVEGIEKARRDGEPGSGVGPKTLQARKHHNEAIGGGVAESCDDGVVRSLGEGF